MVAEHVRVVQSRIPTRAPDPPHGRDDPHPRPRVGDLPVTVGRHAGKTLAECPVDYLVWLVENSTSATYRRAAAELLGVRARPAPPAARTEPRRKRRKRHRDERPAVFTESHLDEVLGVLFKLADEIDRLEGRLHRAEAALQAAGIALPHEG